MKNILLSLIVVVSTSLRAQYSFTACNTGFNTNLSAMDFAVAPNGDIYLVTSHLAGWNAQGVASLFKSSNGGASWQTVNIGSSLSIGRPTAIQFAGNKLLMCGRDPAGTSNYVCASTDFGQTWSVSGLGIPSNFVLVDFAEAPNGNIFLAAYVAGTATNSPRLLASISSGFSWYTINTTGLYPSNAPHFIFCDAKGKLYMSASNNQFSEFYTSNDQGLSWSLISSTIPATTDVIRDIAEGNAGELYATVDNFNANTFNHKLMKSTNSGVTWVPINGISGITLPSFSKSIENIGGDLFRTCFTSGSQGQNHIYKSTMPKKPTVTTNNVIDIGDVSANCGLTLSSDGGDFNTDHGLCWGTASNPSVTLSSTLSTGSGVGTFTANIVNLQPSTTYYVRAFATNSIGTSYGNEVSFTTDFATALYEKKVNSIVSVHPVPASDMLYIFLDRSSKSTIATLYDVTGTVALEFQIEGGENCLDIRSLATGLYFLSTENEQKLKIIKE